MNTEFKNLDDLYNRIKPALYSKVMELKRNHISYVKESDIWNYLSKNVWSKKENLSLNDMVSDIMSLSIDDIKSYVFDILKKRDEEIIKEEGNLLWKRRKVIVLLNV